MTETTNTGSAPQTADRSLDPVLFGVEADNDFSPPEIKQARRRGGYGLILAAAAAVVLLVAGVVSLLPSNTEPALAAVQSAAQATAAAGTGRVEVTVDANGGDSTETGSLDATVTGRYDGSDVAFTIDSFSAETSIEGPIDQEFPVSETRFVDGVLYANSIEEGWIGVEVPQFIGTTLTDLTDPREVLATVQDLVEATEVGPATITDPSGASVETTHYQSVVDLGDESLQQSGWLNGLETADLDADGVVTIDLYVGPDGLINRLVVSGDLDEIEGEGDATFAITTSFYDIGADITVEAPEGAQIMDPMDGGSLFAEFDEADGFDDFADDDNDDNDN